MAAIGAASGSCVLGRRGRKRANGARGCRLRSNGGGGKFRSRFAIFLTSGVDHFEEFVLGAVSGRHSRIVEGWDGLASVGLAFFVDQIDHARKFMCIAINARSKDGVIKYGTVGAARSYAIAIFEEGDHVISLVVATIALFGVVGIFEAGHFEASRGVTPLGLGIDRNHISEFMGGAIQSARFAWVVVSSAVKTFSNAAAFVTSVADVVHCRLGMLVAIQKLVMRRFVMGEIRTVDDGANGMGDVGHLETFMPQAADWAPELEAVAGPRGAAIRMGTRHLASVKKCYKNQKSKI